MSFSIQESRLVDQIVAGCKKIVDEEEVVYCSRLATRTSNSHLKLLSITDFLFSGDFNKPVRPAYIKSKLRDGLKCRDYYRDMNRIFNWQIGKNTLKKESLQQDKKTVGRRKKQDDDKEIPGVKSYYSESGYLQFLKKFICTFTPRVIIYVKLRDSHVLHRALTLLEFNKLMTTRNMSADKFNEAYMKLYPVAESSFKESKYKEDQKILLQKTKKEILKMAVKSAELLFQQLSWKSKLYTEFFIFGGLAYHEPPL